MTRTSSRIAATLVFAMGFSAVARAQAPVCQAGTGVWEPRAAFPLVATEVASAAIGEKIYTLGGFEPGLISTNRLFIYDPFTDSWSEGASLPIPGGVNHANVAAFNGKLYVLGALGAASQPLGQTLEYDPAANRWQERAAMPTPRGAAGVAVLGQRVYVMGGLSAAGSISALESFDPGSNTWAQHAPMPTARDHLTAQSSCLDAACAQPRVFAISGRRSGLLAANEAYDPVSNTWSARAPIPTPRGGIGSGVYHGRIQVFGGEGNATITGIFNQNEEYDPVTDSWCTLAPMPTGRHGLYGATVVGVAGSAADRGRIFAPAGGPREGAFYSNTHEAFFGPPDSRPAAPAGGIVNAASYAPELIPGMLATIFGSNLSAAPQTANKLPLPTQMNATQVLVNGQLAPLLYVSPAQINFQIPYGATSPASIVVRRVNLESASDGPITFQSSAPGIFTVDQSGRGQGAILHAGTAQLASASRPARAGDALEIYLTGLDSCSPLTACVLVVPSVTVGGISAPILASGPSPEFVGLSQVNIRVPAGVAAGLAVPVRVNHLGRVSNEVTIAVQ